MERIVLGKTGLSVSRMGFGGIPIQRVDAEAVCALFDVLVRRGINYIDTARGYTVSEEYIGAAIEGRRDAFILATKSMARTRCAMAQDIETSLRNLRTDYIDIYQVHNPSLEQLEEVCGEGGALEALLEARARGAIGHLGVTAHGLDVFERALGLDWVETIMFPYNIVEGQAEELIQRCKQQNIAFIAMKPLAGGAIEDASLALRYILSNPDVTVVIPGMADVKELEDNAGACEVSALTEADERAIEEVRRRLTGNFCRRCGYCAPCTVGINIPGVFLFAGYLERYGLSDWARDRYAALPVKAGECIKCGACEARCPYGLPISELLARCADEFGE
ncbi:MAG: aldo/keto reductase [Clostridia bacterium]|nr:aldo/keto reductase [Clostridia bacterium]